MTPEEFEIPAPTAPRPLVLVADDRVAAIADLEANYLSRRGTKGVAVSEAGTPVGAFAAYAADFERVWKAKFNWPETVSAVFGAVATERIGETIESLWRRAGVGIGYSGRQSARSERRPVAAVPPEPRCGGVCRRPTCDRSPCVLRETCEKLTSWIPFGLLSRWVCRQVPDPTCILNLSRCNADWALYDLCSGPFDLCSDTIGVIASGLRAFDFDKFGYASVDAAVDVAALVDAGSDLEVSRDLRLIVLEPTVVGDVTIDATVRFEPRASAFLGCAPFEPLRIDDYRLALGEQTPRLVATIAPLGSEDEDGPIGGLDLMVRLAPITLNGQFAEPPLRRLLSDNPTTLLTCPVIYSAMPALELLGATSLTRDALVGALRAMEGSDEQATRTLRMMLDGRLTREFALPTFRISVPAVEAWFGAERMELVPALAGHELRLEAR